MNPMRCVVDASVGIKLFLPEPYADRVQQLFEQLTTETRDSIFVPDLFFIECANILWKKVGRKEYPAALAEQNLADLRAMALPATSCADLMEWAFQLAHKYRITAYDACYLALAERLKVPLLTADEQMAEMLEGAPYEIVTLAHLAT